MIVVLFDQTCFRNLSFLLSYKHLNEIKVLFVTFFVRMFWNKQDQAFNVMMTCINVAEFVLIS